MTEYQYKKIRGENAGGDEDHRTLTGQEGTQEQTGLLLQEPILIKLHP